MSKFSFSSQVKWSILENISPWFYWGRVPDHVNDDDDQRLGGGAHAIHDGNCALLIDTMNLPGVVLQGLLLIFFFFFPFSFLFSFFLSFSFSFSLFFCFPSSILFIFPLFFFLSSFSPFFFPFPHVHFLNHSPNYISLIHSSYSLVFISENKITPCQQSLSFSFWFLFGLFRLFFGGLQGYFQGWVLGLLQKSKKLKNRERERGKGDLEGTHWTRTFGSKKKKRWSKINYDFQHQRSDWSVEGAFEM